MGELYIGMTVDRTDGWIIPPNAIIGTNPDSFHYWQSMERRYESCIYQPLTKRILSGSVRSMTENGKEALVKSSNAIVKVTKDKKCWWHWTRRAMSDTSEYYCLEKYYKVLLNAWQSTGWRDEFFLHQPLNERNLNGSFWSTAEGGKKRCIVLLNVLGVFH